MSGIDIGARTLAGIGAINWGLVSLAEFDLVAAVFGLEFGQPTPPPASSTASSGSPACGSSPGSSPAAKPRGPP